MMTTRQINRIGTKPGKERTQQCKHTPTQDEIAQRCLAIQKEWTDAERLRRGRGGAKAADVEGGARMGRINQDAMGEVA